MLTEIRSDRIVELLFVTSVGGKFNGLCIYGSPSSCPILIAEIDATILWVLHEQFGFGAQRLRTYYDAFHDRIKELVSRYEMEDQDDIWLCTQMLKRIGVDVEAWHKESEHGT